MSVGLWCVTDVPDLKKLWQMYHDTYDVDVLLVPSTPITARPIDNVEPYVEINGRKVCYSWHRISMLWMLFWIKEGSPQCRTQPDSWVNALC